MTQEQRIRSRSSVSDTRQPFPVGDVYRGQAVQTYYPLTVREPDIDWLANETITISSTALAFTKGLAGYDYAKIFVEASAIRLTLDDSIPTASVGFPAEVGDIITLTGIEEIRGFRAIRRDSVDATLTIMYGNRLMVG